MKASKAFASPAAENGQLINLIPPPQKKKSFTMCILASMYIVRKVSVHSSSTVGRLSKPNTRG